MMMRMSLSKVTSRLGTAAVLLWLAAGSAGAQVSVLAPKSWPMWGRGPDHQRRTAALGPQTGASPLWTRTLPSAVEYSPVVGRNTVYVCCDDGKLYALAAATGAISWSYALPVTGNLSAAAVNVPAASTEPATIFVGGEDGNLYAIDDLGLSCALRWKFPAGSPISGCPTLSGCKVYFCTDAGDLLVVHQEDGELYHQYSMGTAPGTSNLCSPAVVTDSDCACESVIYVGDSLGTIYAISDRYPFQAPIWTYSTGNDASLPITVDKGRNAVYALSRNGNLYALNRLTGALLWSTAVATGFYSGAPFSVAMGWKRTLYLGNDEGEIVAVNAVSGVINWKFLTGNYVHSSPAVGRDGTIYCGSDDRVFRALTDLGTSAIVKWSYTNPGVHSSPAIDDDGVLYVATLQTSTVYAFKN